MTTKAKTKTKRKKHTTDFSEVRDAQANGGAGTRRNFERKDKRGPGRPIGKRSNPAFQQYTVLIRKTTHHKAIEKLRKTTARPDFGEYVEVLILNDLTHKES